MVGAVPRITAAAQKGRCSLFVVSERIGVHWPGVAASASALAAEVMMSAKPPLEEIVAACARVPAKVMALPKGASKRSMDERIGSSGKYISRDNPVGADTCSSSRVSMVAGVSRAGRMIQKL